MVHLEEIGVFWQNVNQNIWMIMVDISSEIFCWQTLAHKIANCLVLSLHDFRQFPPNSISEIIRQYSKSVKISFTSKSGGFGWFKCWLRVTVCKYLKRTTNILHGGSQKINLKYCLLTDANRNRLFVKPR